jgi:hypothetical protein
MSLMNLMEFRDIVVVSLLRREVFRVQIEEEDNRENDFGPFGLNICEGNITNITNNTLKLLSTTLIFFNFIFVTSHVSY